MQNSYKLQDGCWNCKYRLKLVERICGDSELFCAFEGDTRSIQDMDAEQIYMTFDVVSLQGICDLHTSGKGKEEDYSSIY